MNIPKEVVEAAARAVYENNYQGVRAGFQWGGSEGSALQHSYLQEMRIALEVAAPFLKADAWDEGYRSCDEVWKQTLEGGWDRPERDDDVPEIDYTKNPYREESPDA